MTGIFLSRPPPLFENRNAVHFRQTDIEDHDVIGLGVAEEIAFLAIERGIDRIAGIPQRRDQLAVEVFVIFDDECAHGKP